MASEEIEQLKPVIDHVATGTSATSMGLLLTNVSVYIPILAGALAISWYIYRYYEKFVLIPDQESKLKAEYQKELGQIFDKSPEFFRDKSLEILRVDYEAAKNDP